MTKKDKYIHWALQIYHAPKNNSLPRVLSKVDYYQCSLQKSEVKSTETNFYSQYTRNSDFARNFSPNF